MMASCRMAPRTIWILGALTFSLAIPAWATPTPAPASSAAAASPVTVAPMTGQSWLPQTSMPAPDSVNGVMAGAVRAHAPPAATRVPWIRAQQIQQTAAAFGAQAGMMARARQIDDELAMNAAMYNKAFDFAKLELPGGVMPPVITEGRDSFNLSSPDVLRAEGRLYDIVVPARLVASPPTWRDYLWMPTGKLEVPASTLLPTTSDERALWDVWVRRGWEEGDHLADAEFHANLARMQRDMLGMVRYRMLEAQGLVVAPVIRQDHLGVTGGGNTMAIDDRVIAIRQPARLDPDTHRWEFKKPVTNARDLISPPKPSPLPSSGGDE